MITIIGNKFRVMKDKKMTSGNWYEVHYRVKVNPEDDTVILTTEYDKAYVTDISIKKSPDKLEREIANYILSLPINQDCNSVTMFDSGEYVYYGKRIEREIPENRCCRMIKQNTEGLSYCYVCGKKIKEDCHHVV